MGLGLCTGYCCKVCHVSLLQFNASNLIMFRMHARTQSHSDDPPFLTVGTEVSAKYRGAFCEATIKVAKKLVKCKVSRLAA